MSDSNPYQAPQEALTSSALPVNLQALIPWDEEGRRTLQLVAEQHRWMMRLYLIFLLYGGCCCLIGYYGSKYLSREAGDLLALQVVPLPFLYIALIYRVYHLAKLLHKSFPPLTSILLRMLFPYSLAVPIFYHRRAGHCFARFGIPLRLWGIDAGQLDTRIAAEYDAFCRNSASSQIDSAPSEKRSLT